MKQSERLAYLYADEILYLDGLYQELSTKQSHLQQYGQICLRYPSSKSQFAIDDADEITARDYGCGSLQRNNRALREKDFDVWCRKASIFLVEIVSRIMDMQKAISDRPLGLGRVRFMTMAPKTCLSYHQDPEPLRFHVPIITNDCAFFVVDGETEQMSEPAGVYALRTQKMHTAVNASFDKPRTHLVISTWDMAL